MSNQYILKHKYFNADFPGLVQALQYKLMSEQYNMLQLKLLKSDSS